MSRVVRIVVALLGLSLVPATAAGAASTTGAQAPPPDARKGVVLDGLLPTVACKGKLQVALRIRPDGQGPISCTHRPDPAPDGVDVRLARSTAELAPAAAAGRGAAIAAPAAPPLACYGDGTSGYRVQVIFARASDVPDRFAALQPSLVQWSAAADTVVSASAAETGGVRHIRFVTGPGCALSIARVTLPASGDDTFGATIAELVAQGYARTDRKYLVYVDANVYCGIGEMYFDDRASTTPGVNYNNGHLDVEGTVARVDNGCWGLPNSVEAHELMHNLGGVQDTAPHHTTNAHCTDDYDRMCYEDGAGVVMTYPCAAAHENRYDCNHDDYFSTNPPVGNYLATHWNAANSAFLAAAEPFPARAWGYNEYGQVGDGSSTNRPTPTVLSPTKVDAVAAGGDHSLVLSGGQVRSWGLNHVGQLGRGNTTATIPTPGLVGGGLSGVTAVAAGYYHSLALKGDGTVWSWGWNYFGQLGDGTTVDRSLPVQVVGLTNVVAISAGGLHNLALKGDGTVWAWGSNSVGQLGKATPAQSALAAQVPGLTGVTAISAGLYHNLVVRPGGSVASWGWNAYGQLGDWTTTTRTAPVTVPGLTTIVAVSAGAGHSLALGADGQVRSWGLAASGQLGRPVAGQSPIAGVVPGLSTVSAISAGGYHSLAVTTGGVLAAWGWNALGQVGDGTTVDRAAPVVVVGVAGPYAVSAGLTHDVVAAP
ncbi:MAG: hypothetical protein QOG82_2679 [Actinomycetota bacterium]|nr:hypothetical protein [Actinomycetota bacterium]